MKEYKFLRWMTEHTQSRWWHDSADPRELAEALRNGATGVTTNPFLIQGALHKSPEIWRGILAERAPEACGAEEIMKTMVAELSKQARPVFDQTGGKSGYACIQVDPQRQGDAEAMLEQARRYTKIAPNISAKIPACAAGYEAMEACVAEGMCTTMTVSFTVSQAIATALHYERAAAKAEARGIAPGPCYAVLMIGRFENYLRDIARDSHADAGEEDILMAGAAIAKRAYEIFRERNFRTVIMPSGMQNADQVLAMAGAGMVFSVSPRIQDLLEQVSGPFVPGIDRPVDAGTMERLLKIREFRRAYEPDGMREDEFLAYGAAQRTLSQYIESGWLLIR